LKLPTASKRLKDPPREANYSTVQADGKMFLNKKELTSTDEMLSTLIGLRTVHQDLSVIVRGDGKTKYRQIRAVLDVCQQANVPKVNLATETVDRQ
jgi:biopolymer transport protein ExbD